MPRLAGEIGPDGVVGAPDAATPAGSAATRPVRARMARVARLGVRHGSLAEITRMLDGGAAAVAALGYTTGRRTTWDDAAEVELTHGSPWHRLVLSAVAAPQQPEDLSDPLFAELDRHDVTVHAVEGASAIDPARFHEVVSVLRTACAPFTTAESTTIGVLNPLVNQLVDDYGTQGVDLSGIHLVLREHLLLEKLNLLAGLRTLGLSPDRTHVVRKRDSTRYWPRICAELRDWGVAVYPDVGHAEIPALVDLVEHEIAMSDTSGPVVVVDDGADLLATWLARPRSEGARVFPVETTTKGMTLLRAAGLADGVVDLASCSVKKGQSRQIAVSCVQRFRELLQHEPVEGQWCHVVGYGQLGSHVAALLRAIGLRVTVSELSPRARERAGSAGFPAYDDAATALRAHPHRYLFGCSGSPVVGLGEVALMTDRPVVCSLSSQDLAPLLVELRPYGLRTRHGLGLTCTTGRQKVTVLGQGDAVNLFLAEGVPEPDFDPFTAMTLATVVEQARVAEANGGMLSPGTVRRLSARMRRRDA